MLSAILSPGELRRNNLTRRATRLNLLICGRSCTGKKTFLDTLFNKVSRTRDHQTPEANFGLGPNEDIDKDTDNDNGNDSDLDSTLGGPVVHSNELNFDDSAHAHANANASVSAKNLTYTTLNSSETLEFQTHMLKLKEPNSSPIILQAHVTKGFGEFVNNTNSCVKLVNFIEKLFNEILEEECKIKRNPKSQDNRINAILYFVPANSKGLDKLDIEAMKLLGQRSNLIPIISKADLLTPEELRLNKRIIKKDIISNKIKVFDFNYCGTAYDSGSLIFDPESSEPDSGSTTLDLNEMIPFSIIGANEVITLPNGQKNNFRKYSWGQINIDDPQICDFKLLKSILFGSHLQDFLDTTHNEFYENYRTSRLSLNGV